MITPAERLFAIKQLDHSREQLLLMLKGLSAEQLAYRPGPQRWSIADNVEHLVVVERRLTRAIQKLLQEPPDLSKQSVMCDAEVVWLVGNVREPVAAPETSFPNSRWQGEVLLQEFEAARRQARELADVSNDDLRRHFITHGIFGDLDCYQWILLIGAHCDRHRSQSEAVKTSSGFPA